MFKRNQSLFFLLILGFLFLPFSVWAEPNVLTYETIINNWEPNNELYITRSTSFPTGAVASWSLHCDEDVIPLTSIANGYVFQNVDDECSSATFVETVNFDGITLTSLGLNTNSSITPSVFSPSLSEGGNIPTSVRTYMFQNLGNTYYPANYYVLNTVDQYGNINGAPYIREIYFSNELEEKTTEDVIGSINLANYEVRASLAVKGNIANPHGNFFFTKLVGGDTNTFSYDDYENPVTVFELDSSNSLNSFYEDVEEAMLAQYGFGETASSADDNYTVTVENAATGAESFDESLMWDGNTVYLSYNVSAFLGSDGSDTGLFYNLWPFILMILFGGAFLFFFVRGKKKQKKVSIVDEEIL